MAPLTLPSTIRICSTFDCPKTQLQQFSNITDPFNPSNTISGQLCKKEGAFIGSMMITEINNKSTKQVIYGTPKMNLPYQNNQKGLFIDFLSLYSCCVQLVLTNKWNGANVMFFKYSNDKDEVFITAKTR